MDMKKSVLSIRKKWYVDVSIIPEQGEIASEKEYRIEKFHCGEKEARMSIR